MNMTLDDYLKKLPPARRAKVEQRAKELIAEELTLQELRKAKQQSQETMADLLGVKQAEVSKMERRTDMYLSTLRRYIEAMGGHLEIVASFPNASSVRIKNLHSLGLEDTDSAVDDKKRTTKPAKTVRSVKRADGQLKRRRTKAR
jgi:transcriptional regulator with XRE-family HTH domain